MNDAAEVDAEVQDFINKLKKYGPERWSLGPYPRQPERLLFTVGHHRVVIDTSGLPWAKVRETWRTLVTQTAAGLDTEKAYQAFEAAVVATIKAYQ